MEIIELRGILTKICKYLVFWVCFVYESHEKKQQHFFTFQSGTILTDVLFESILKCVRTIFMGYIPQIDIMIFLLPRIAARHIIWSFVCVL